MGIQRPNGSQIQSRWLYWLLGSSVQKQHVETEKDLLPRLANTGGLVYNPRVVTSTLMHGRRYAHVMENFWYGSYFDPSPAAEE